MKPVILNTPSFFSVTFVEEGRPILVMADDSRFEKCLSLYKNEDYSGLKSFLCPDKALEQISDGDLIINIDEGEIQYKGEPIHNVVAGRIMEAIDGKLPYKHLLAFLKNTLFCDSFVVLNELYLFLESNESMPIMEDGSFIAYRAVDSEYMSKHPNKDGTHNRNHVGDIISMPRNQVNPNRHQTCAEGLHFCSYSYIPFYGYNKTDRIMIVKIYPTDVVAIPDGYNNAKGRCCKYEVIGEVENYERNSDEFRQRVEEKAHSLAYDYEDKSEADFYDEDERDFIEAFDGLSDFEEDDETIEDALAKDAAKDSEFYEKESTVMRVIHTQLRGQYGTGSTTARRVSKSTKPYVSCQEVIDIAQGLDAYVVRVETPLSQSTISFS